MDVHPAHLLQDYGLLSVTPGLAHALGDPSRGIAVQDLHYAVLRGEGQLFDDGRRWVQRSVAQWCELLTWYDERTVRRMLKLLVEDGYLRSTNFGGANWYALAYERLGDTLGKMPSPRTECPPPGQNAQVKMSPLAAAAESVTGAGAEVTAEGGQNAPRAICPPGKMSDLSSYTNGLVDGSSSTTSPRDGDGHPNGMEMGTPGHEGVQPLGLNMDTSDEEKAQGTRKGPKKSAARPAASYDAAFYEAKFTEEAWAALRECGTLPENETMKTALVAAFLVGMKLEHGVGRAVTGSQLSGRVGKQAKELWAHVLANAGGEEIRAINDALDYVRWFLTTDDDWIEANRTITICFMASRYDTYLARKDLKPKRAKGRGSLAHADGVGVILTSDERRNLKGIVF